MTKDKSYDAVKAMREVREELSEKYFMNTELLKKEMDEMKKKYDLKLSDTSKRRAA